MNQTDMNIDFFLTWLVGLVAGLIFEICRKKLKDKRQKKNQDLIDKEDQKFREVFKELYSDTKK